MKKDFAKNKKQTKEFNIGDKNLYKLLKFKLK